MPACSIGVNDGNQLIDGNKECLGLLVDNVVSIFANVFAGLATFGSTMGLLIGVAFVLGLIFVATGKVNIGNITKGFK